MKNLIFFFFLFGHFLTFSQINEFHRFEPSQPELSSPPTNMLIDILIAKQRYEEEKFMNEIKRKYKGKIHIYGGINSHDTYLGCLNCPNNDDLSIWNRYGDFGFSNLNWKENIWNEKSKFGSKNTDYSPWSRFAFSPPAIVDFYGEFYGYFSSNPSKNQTDLGLYQYILDNKELIKDNYNFFGGLFDDDGTFDTERWISFIEDNQYESPKPSYTRSQNSSKQNHPNTTYSKRSNFSASSTNDPYGYNSKFYHRFENEIDENSLRTKTVATCQLWPTASRFKTPRTRLTGGTNVKIENYENEFWKVTLDNGIEGYVWDGAIYRTSAMIRLKERVNSEIKIRKEKQKQTQIHIQTQKNTIYNYYFLTDKTSLRSFPDSKSNVLKRFSGGERVNVLDYSGDWWWKVDYLGQIGWVKKRLLVKN